MNEIDVRVIEGAAYILDEPAGTCKQAPVIPYHSRDQHPVLPAQAGIQHSAFSHRREPTLKLHRESEQSAPTLRVWATLQLPPDTLLDSRLRGLLI